MNFMVKSIQPSWEFSLWCIRADYCLFLKRETLWVSDIAAKRQEEFPILSLSDKAQSKTNSADKGLEQLGRQSLPTPGLQWQLRDILKTSCHDCHASLCFPVCFQVDGFFTLLFGLASINTLTVISVTRYIKGCHPNKGQLKPPTDLKCVRTWSKRQTGVSALLTFLQLLSDTEVCFAVLMKPYYRPQLWK